MTRFFSLLAGALALTALAAASTFAQGRVLTIASPWEVTDLDPAANGYVLQRLGLAETLVDATVDGALAPGLATGWTTSADGLTWTFAVRDGVTFQDGSALTAAAAAGALQRAAQRPGLLAKAPVASIRAEGNAVVVETSERFGALASILAHSTAVILSPSSYNAAGEVVEAFGTGPYEVVAFGPPLTLEVGRYGDYWGEAPQVEAVVYRATGRAETRALMAESGDADLVFTLDPAGMARLAGVEEVTLHTVPIPRVVVLKPNAGHPFLADRRARQALSLAIDRAGIAAGIARAREVVANQVFAPGLGRWHNPGLPAPARDVARARALLAQLGWSEGGDGVLTRDGERFSVTLRTFPDRPELPLMAAAIQDQFREIGVEVEISLGNFSEIPAGHQDGSLELALYARNYGITTDPIAGALADYGRGGGDWGAMNWERPDVAEALERIAAGGGDVAADVAQVVAALAEDLPIIPITYYRHTVAQSARIANVVVDPLERSYYIDAIRWAQ